MYEPHPSVTHKNLNNIHRVVSGPENHAYTHHYAYVSKESYMDYKNDPRSWQPMPEYKKL